MTDSPPQDPPPKREPTQTAVRIPFEKRRWRFTREGRDFGPYSGTAVAGKITDRELDESTILFEEWEGKSIRLTDVPEFARIMEEVRREIMLERLEMETEKTTEKVQASARKRLVVGLGGLTLGVLAIAIIGQFAFNAATPPSSQFAVSMFPERDIQPIENIEIRSVDSETKAETVESGTGSPNKKVKRKRRKNRNGPGREVPPTLRNTNGAGLLIFGTKKSLSFSFEKETKKTIENKVFDSKSASAKVSGKLSKCMNVEGRTRNEFQGGDIIFGVNGTGRVQYAKIKNAGNVSSSLVSCIKSVFSNVRFGEFSGGPQRVKIPIRIRSTAM